MPISSRASQAFTSASMTDSRKIIHIDMDAFYASVEQLDNPELRGKPVIVGGRPDSRGVVAACSYEARAFGIRSAIACSRAYKLCPDAIFIPPRMTRYREFSERIMSILRQYTEIIEPLSLDEAFLDITTNKKNQPSATILAEQIRRHIFQDTGLTASAGVSCNKFIAKIASDLNKPDGIAVIRPDQVTKFLETLPIGKFFGVGKATEKKMFTLGIRTGADLKKLPIEELLKHFGKPGQFYFNMVRGNDPRPVRPHRVRKSIGAERTLKVDTRDMAQLQAILSSLVDRVCRSLSKRNLACHTVTVKVRYADFTTITRSISSRQALSESHALMTLAESLLKKTEAGSRKIRLVGISVSNLEKADVKKVRQLPLPFPELSLANFRVFPREFSPPD